MITHRIPFLPPRLLFHSLLDFCVHLSLIFWQPRGLRRDVSVRVRYITSAASIRQLGACKSQSHSLILLLTMRVARKRHSYESREVGMQGETICHVYLREHYENCRGSKGELS